MNDIIMLKGKGKWYDGHRLDPIRHLGYQLSDEICGHCKSHLNLVLPPPPGPSLWPDRRPFIEDRGECNVSPEKRLQIIKEHEARWRKKKRKFLLKLPGYIILYYLKKILKPFAKITKIRLTIKGDK